MLILEVPEEESDSCVIHESNFLSLRLGSNFVATILNSAENGVSINEGNLCSG